MIRLSRLDRKNPSAGLAKFYAQLQILWIISRQLCLALQYHDARYLCGVKGGSDRTMSTFCFINAATRYHDSPVKQRAVHKGSKGGIAHHGRFSPLPIYKEPSSGGWYAQKSPRNASISET